MPINDVWSRDNGPIFIKNNQGGLAVSGWNFNGWGDRYPYQKDRLIPEKVAETLSLPMFNPPITLEGGAIEVNGQGTLIATRSSILNPNRNPDISQEMIETVLGEYLGVQHVIWLSGAPREFCDKIGDETDLHIDLEARFTDESTVLYSWTEDESSLYYPYLKQHRDELREAVTETGKTLVLAPLPKPKNIFYKPENDSKNPPFRNRLSLATYTNFYIANQVVLVPVYGDVNDSQALTILSEHFPDREIIGISVPALAELGGMIHCVTQQQPVAEVNA
jgi:agmatine deiminase